MPLLGVRPRRSDRDLKRRSTLDPTSFFLRRSEQASRPNASAEFLHPDRGAALQDGSTPDLAGESPRPSVEPPAPSPPIQEPTPNTKRFSMLRHRHASDSQLSAKVRAQAQTAEPVPPVPAIAAAPAPAIIMTAPTMEIEDKPQRKKSKFLLSTRRRNSAEPSAGRLSFGRKSVEKRRDDVENGTDGGTGSLEEVVDASGEPGRLSVNHARKAPSDPGAEAASPLVPPAARYSDSSRSDASSGTSADHVTFASPATHPSHNKTLFSLPRKKKNRNSLFPLPVKIPPPEPPNTAPATPRASTSALSSGSPIRSLGDYSPPLTAIRRSNTANSSPLATQPLPLPLQNGLAPSTVSFVSALLRNDSTTSARSSRSSPALAPPTRLTLRERSSTMGSTSEHPEHGQPLTPPFAPSGRNSTSTAGRNSFSHLFGLGHRLRKDSGPDSPRHGSPGRSFPPTSGRNSHSTSLNISREHLIIPEREEGESPGRYLERLEETVNRSLIGTILAKSDDPFLMAVMRSYMRRLTFFGDPIDMAIRKMLMEVELPHETQQIDRVLGSFADRYCECNPGIFVSADKAHFITFSIIMLHTDVFNPNNKRKMQRPDYIKNCRADGVPADDVLACIYDNIVYTPFIHIHDEFEIKGTASRRKKTKNLIKSAAADPVKKATKEPIDPYTIILDGKMDVLRPPIKDVMNLDDPYAYAGTAPGLDIKYLHNSFARCGVIQIVSARSRPEAFMSPTTIENPLDSQAGLVEMPVTRVGILWRKDTKRKAARSPWQEWGAILTRSGLSFFKNAMWVKSLMHQLELNEKRGHGGVPVIFKPALQDFKADHVIPMDGAVAVHDATYKKHKHSFFIYAKGGAEEVFLADSERDMNDWLGKLNYTAAFETSGTRPRGLIGGNYDGQRQRGLRRLQSDYSATSVQTATGEVTIQRGRIDTQLAQQIAAARRDHVLQRISEAEERLSNTIKQLDEQLRDARHLQLMAPIQPKTREHVVHAAGRMSAKLKWTRIEICRMKCHRDILALDLEEERRATGESQARIEQVRTGSAVELSPRHLKGGHLARLNSKASTVISSQKSPTSPVMHSPQAFTLRPGTNSSLESEAAASDVFRTPPEATSPLTPQHPQARWKIPPLTVESPPSDHLNSPAQSSRPDALEHRPSVSSISQSSISSVPSRYATPAPSDDPARAVLENGIGVAMDGGRPGTASSISSITDRPPPSTVAGSPNPDLGLGDPSTGKDSVGSNGTAVADDCLHISPDEGLQRGKGPFTVHGKKASVITFGGEWGKLSAEERLMARKQQAVEEDKSPQMDKEIAESVATDEEVEPVVPIGPGGGAMGDHKRELGMEALKATLPTMKPPPADAREVRALSSERQPASAPKGVEPGKEQKVWPGGERAAQGQAVSSSVAKSGEGAKPEALGGQSSHLQAVEA
ncbi:hypothetical protein H2199_006359 [Coniosporium tulheliwenetii]|uniref:Uncharacterized protein n=1 Tax=Coniosporium tulheliwenetii TaxID=3383036 RepID=A0ACC2YW84_9PEZI|nr:hypothetical protein H2199_006359 [Cladosporium sp. JES 115]